MGVSGDFWKGISVADSSIFSINSLLPLTQQLGISKSPDSTQPLSGKLRLERASLELNEDGLAVDLKRDAILEARVSDNVSQAAALLDIVADGLNGLDSISSQLSELAATATDYALSREQRQAIHDEAVNLVTDYNRIAQTTVSDALPLLGQSSSLSISVENAQSLVVSLGQSLERTVGDGSFGAATSTTTGAVILDIASDYINDDEYLDVITGSIYDSFVTVLFGRGDGTFDPAVTYATTDESISVELADIDGDTHLDILTMANDQTLNVLMGQAGGTFAAAVSYGVSGVPTNITVTDVDRDGAADIVASGYASVNISVLKGVGDGTFNPVETYAPGHGSAIVAVGDFNGDYVEDIVASGYFSDKVSLLLGNADGSFKAATVIGTDADPWGLVAADFDGDGNMDLASAGQQLLVRFGNGNGTFGAAVDLGLSIQSLDLAATDFNGDGVLDLVTGAIAGTGVSVFLGNVDGTFAAESRFETNGAGFSITTGDINADGVHDIITSDYDNQGIDVLIASTKTTTTIPYVSLATTSYAEDADETIDDAISRVTDEADNLSAIFRRLESAEDVAATRAVALEAARNSIRDPGSATDLANDVKDQVRKDALSGILAQANLSPARVKDLLSE